MTRVHVLVVSDGHAELCGILLAGLLGIIGSVEVLAINGAPEPLNRFN